MTRPWCVCCGQPLTLARVCDGYCSVACANAQVRALGMLLHSTPRQALDVLEWHELSGAYVSDLEALRRLNLMVVTHPSP